jgi:hypothetical protein
MTPLNGTWVYQSFRPFSGPPSPLMPWSSVGRLSVTTDQAGKVDGRLTVPLPPDAPIPALLFTISGSVIPASEGPLSVPERVELTGKLTSRDGRESVNELRGYFVAGGANPVICGTIVSVRNDPAGEPDGTSGPFVLVPAGS